MPTLRALRPTIARREQVQAKQSVVTKDRLRAFTLLSRAYNEARRAAVYLRWNDGDADSLVPSFYGAVQGDAKAPTRKRPRRSRG